jgi:hypothetical protein
MTERVSSIVRALSAAEREGQEDVWLAFDTQLGDVGQAIQQFNTGRSMQDPWAMFHGPDQYGRCGLRLAPMIP